jgi:hypothetical protein
MARRTSIDYRGVGQSGYTAGRAEDDPALELQLEITNQSYPRSEEEEQLQNELETDDRWTGRGGPIPREGAPETDP